MPVRTKDEEAEELARTHYEVEPGLSHVFRLTGPGGAEDDPAEPIKLLEVHELTVPAGIMPIRFGPDPAHGRHYSSVIVEVTPEEYERIGTNELPLPGGWTVGSLIPKAAAGAAR